MNQLLVLDLDGTLLRNDKTVSEETINSLIEFENRNNKIIFAIHLHLGYNEENLQGGTLCST